MLPFFPMYCTHPIFNLKEPENGYSTQEILTSKFLSILGILEAAVTNIGQITCHKQSRGKIYTLDLYWLQ